MSSGHDIVPEFEGHQTLAIFCLYVGQKRGQTNQSSHCGQVGPEFMLAHGPVSGFADKGAVEVQEERRPGITQPQPKE